MLCTSAGRVRGRVHVTNCAKRDAVRVQGGTVGKWSVQRWSDNLPACDLMRTVSASQGRSWLRVDLELEFRTAGLIPATA